MNCVAIDGDWFLPKSQRESVIETNRTHWPHAPARFYRKAAASGWLANQKIWIRIT